MTAIRTKRLASSDRVEAMKLFEMMAEVFSEESVPLTEQYIDHLLGRRDFWAIAAFASEEIIGGITAHALPMTRTASYELFIYDIAVRAEFQHQGVGKSLVSALREQALSLGIQEVFVAADNADTNALDFYRALGGRSSAVTIFTFTITGI
jgi:aminoglycoside 3-N-acetyltransferase I